MSITGRGLWSDPSVPKSGWIWQHTEDLGTSEHTCEMCLNEAVRYVHHLHHPAIARTLLVGCVCAGHLQGDVQAAHDREAPLRARAKRRQTWAKHGWLLVEDRYVKRSNIFTVEAYERPQPHFRIIDRVTGEVRESRRTYPSLQAVKLVTYDAVEWLKER